MSSGKTEAAVFRALANDRRREILDRLKDRALTTGELCDRMKKVDRCTVMQHLTVLARAGLVVVRRDGRQRWNHLDVAPIRRIYERWISRYAAPSVELLMRLKRDLER